MVFTLLPFIATQETPIQQLGRCRLIVAVKRRSAPHGSLGDPVAPLLRYSDYAVRRPSSPFASRTILCSALAIDGPWAVWSKVLADHAC
jgi:hypothetical protein